MTTNWKAISSILEKHQKHLDKAQSAVILVKEQLATKQPSLEASRHIDHILELERDIQVTKNRISFFIENHCQKGEVTSKWLSRRDSISEQFSFVSSKASKVCGQAIQYITSNHNEGCG